jgi:SAM-dependent methyltransferase
MFQISKRDTCRICNNPNLTQILDFGDMYLAGYTSKEDELKPVTEKAPMVLVRCTENPNNPSCGLVQLLHTVDSDVMYRRYFYRSGINKTMPDNLCEIVEQTLKKIDIRSDDIVVDIGCNDGTLLKNYQGRNLTSVGFDPAKNMLQYSKESGATIITEYFDSDLYFQKFDKKAKVITSIAMFYDLEYPNKFVSDISKILDENGVWVLELAYLPLTLSQLAFDTVVHEHLEYYHLKALEFLLNIHDLQVTDVFLNDINGGSFRLFVNHKGLKIEEPAQNRIDDLRKFENDLHLDTEKPYVEFVDKLSEEKQKLVSFLKNETKSGKIVYGYGASTKGATLLQYYGINNNLITAIADRNPDKWGRITIGTNIPIISEDEARKNKPDYFLVLPWHFIEEFVQREKKFLREGGKFISPLPKFKIISE